MSYVIAKDGTKISYSKEGVGTPIILVGGALQTKADRLFARLILLLSKDFVVVSYDRRGRGDSGTTAPYAVEREVEDLEALIESLGGNVCLFGNSSGAQLALRAASQNAKVTKVAVYEAPFISDEELGSAKEYIGALSESISRGDLDRTLKLFFARIGVPGPVRFIMRLLPMWKGLRSLAPTLLHDALVVGDGSVSPELKSISARTLAISGSSQRMVEAAQKLTAVVPRAGAQVLQGQSHAVNPAVLAEALRAFFRS